VERLPESLLGLWFISFPFCFGLFFVFGHYVVQAGIEPMIPLPHSSECWDRRHPSSHPALPASLFWIEPSANSGHIISKADVMVGLPLLELIAE
jgi:hypothetical protein